MTPISSLQNEDYTSPRRASLRSAKKINQHMESYEESNIGPMYKESGSSVESSKPLIPTYGYIYSPERRSPRGRDGFVHYNRRVSHENNVKRALEMQEILPESAKMEATVPNILRKPCFARIGVSPYLPITNFKLKESSVIFCGGLFVLFCLVALCVRIFKYLKGKFAVT